MRTKIIASIFALALIPVSAHAAGDAAKGKRVFNKCRACHNVDKPKNKIGPHLVGIVGRKAGSVEGYRYSSSMKKAAAGGLVWSVENLDKFLAAPRKFMSGNKMPFGGLKKQTDRENLIAYLQKAAK